MRRPTRRSTALCALVAARAAGVALAQRGPRGPGPGGPGRGNEAEAGGSYVRTEGGGLVDEAEAMQVEIALADPTNGPALRRPMAFPWWNSNCGTTNSILLIPPARLKLRKNSNAWHWQQTHAFVLMIRTIQMALQKKHSPPRMAFAVVAVQTVATPASV